MSKDFLKHTTQVVMISLGAGVLGHYWSTPLGIFLGSILLISGLDWRFSS